MGIIFESFSEYVNENIDLQKYKESVYSLTGDDFVFTQEVYAEMLYSFINKISPKEFTDRLKNK